MYLTAWMRRFGQTSRLGACRLGAVVSCRVVSRAARRSPPARLRVRCVAAAPRAGRRHTMEFSGTFLPELPVSTICASFPREPQSARGL